MFWGDLNSKAGGLEAPLPPCSALARNTGCSGKDARRHCALPHLQAVPAGIEPAPIRSTIGRSTTELRGHGSTPARHPGGENGARGRSQRQGTAIASTSNAGEWSRARLHIH